MKPVDSVGEREKMLLKLNGLKTHPSNSFLSL